jgi:hypothetical protein
MGNDDNSYQPNLITSANIDLKQCQRFKENPVKKALLLFTECWGGVEEKFTDSAQHPFAVMPCGPAFAKVGISFIFFFFFLDEGGLGWEEVRGCPCCK